MGLNDGLLENGGGLVSWTGPSRWAGSGLLKNYERRLCRLRCFSRQRREAAGLRLGRSSEDMVGGDAAGGCCFRADLTTVMVAQGRGRELQEESGVAKTSSGRRFSELRAEEKELAVAKLVGVAIGAAIKAVTSRSRLRRKWRSVKRCERARTERISWEEERGGRSAAADVAGGDSSVQLTWRQAVGFVSRLISREGESLREEEGEIEELYDGVLTCGERRRGGGEAEAGGVAEEIGSRAEEAHIVAVCREGGC